MVAILQKWCCNLLTMGRNGAILTVRTAPFTKGTNTMNRTAFVLALTDDELTAELDMYSR
jgi:hypothetical protein